MCESVSAELRAGQAQGCPTGYWCYCCDRNYLHELFMKLETDEQREGGRERKG